MKRLSIALISGVLLTSVPIVAKADTAIAVVNVESKTVQFSARCLNDSGGWHNYSVDPGKTQVVDGLTDWNFACGPVYEFLARTANDDGTPPTQSARMNDGHTYMIVDTASVGFTIHDAQSMIVVANNSGRDLALNYKCEAVGDWQQMQVSAHDRTWLFVGEPPGCRRYVAAVREPGREDASLPTTPMPIGRIYTLTWNGDSQMWSMRSVSGVHDW
ncbi:MAG TPA: hypothetical protein VHS78_11535 [Candidatus Elarobacter sp.]|jgi:hypothetical protein|nr:hypothetical protein [Candidatus Elarobacter sp.]